MIGAAVALLTSLAWAGSSVIIKFLTARIDSLSLNTIRMWVGSLTLLSLILLSGKQSLLIGTPLTSLVYVILSGITAMALGDTLYIKSLSLLDASISFALSQCTFVVLTVLIAVMFMGESITWITAIGAAFVIFGICMIAVPEGGKGATDPVRRKITGYGSILILAAASAWTAAVVLLKVGTAGMDPVVAAEIRITASAVALSFAAFLRRDKGAMQFREYGSKDLSLTATTGVLTYGVAAVGYVMAIQLIGAGKTALLTSTAPLFVLPLSIIFLKERPTRLTIAGILVCVAGICLVVV